MLNNVLRPVIVSRLVVIAGSLLSSDAYCQRSSVSPGPDGAAMLDSFMVERDKFGVLLQELTTRDQLPGQLRFNGSLVELIQDPDLDSLFPVYRIATGFVEEKSQWELASRIQSELNLATDVSFAVGPLVRYGTNRSAVLGNIITMRTVEDADEQQVTELIQQAGGQVRYRYPFDKTVLHVEIRGAGVLSAVGRFRDSRWVKWAVPTLLQPVRELTRDSDPGIDCSPWHHRHANGTGINTAELASLPSPTQATGTGSPPRTVIAFIDRVGVEFDHPALADRLWTNDAEKPEPRGKDHDENDYPNDVHGWDFMDRDGKPEDTSGHGTAVAGSAVARGTNTNDIVGTHPGALAMILRARNTSQHAEAVRYAWRNGADVICITRPQFASFPDELKLLRIAVHEAATCGREGKGCVIVNAMDDKEIMPDCRVNSISDFGMTLPVSRSSMEGRKGTFGDKPTAFGNCMSVMAPGENIATTTLQKLSNGRCKKGYDRQTGTSLATGITAGVAALVLSENPELGQEQVRNLLQDTSDRIEASAGAYRPDSGFSDPDEIESTHGFGRINAYEAVRVVAGGPRGRAGVDVFIRDHDLDWGNTLAPSYTSFDPDHPAPVPYWTSPDIKIDARPFQEPPPQDSDSFDDFEDEMPRTDGVNRVYVRIRNRGPLAAESTAVGVYAVGGLKFPAPNKPETFQHPLSVDADHVTQLSSDNQIIGSLQYCGSSAVHSCKPDLAAVVRFEWDASGISDASITSSSFALLAAAWTDSDSDLATDDAFHSESEWAATRLLRNVAHNNNVALKRISPRD